MGVSWREISRLQKGIHFTSYVNKPLEDALVYLLARVEFITADHITILADSLAFLSAYLMVTGRVWPAIALMLAVTILDGTDGKLARLRGKPTKIGKLEHSLDFLYEQAWYASVIAYTYLSTKAVWTLLLGLGWLVVDGYVRHVYNLGWIVAGGPLKKWGRAGRIIALVDGRRNVYVWYTTASYIIAGTLWPAITLSFSHALATAVAYTVLTYRKIGELSVAKGF